MKEDNQILHKCPKRGCHFPIDVKKTPVCPHCKFKVYNLLLNPHKLIRYIVFFSFLPLIIIIMFIITNYWQPLVWLLITAPMYVAIYFANRFLIAQNHLNFFRCLINQESNWVNRKN